MKYNTRSYKYNLKQIIKWYRQLVWFLNAEAQKSFRLKLQRTSRGNRNSMAWRWQSLTLISRTQELHLAPTCSWRMESMFALDSKLQAIQDQLTQEWIDLPRCNPWEQLLTRLDRTCMPVWSGSHWRDTIQTPTEADSPAQQSWCHTKTHLKSWLVIAAATTESNSQQLTGTPSPNQCKALLQTQAFLLNSQSVPITWWTNEHETMMNFLLSSRDYSQISLYSKQKNQSVAF